VNFARVERAAGLAILSRMVGNPKWDWSGGLVGAQDLADAGEMYAVVDDQGAPAAFFVLQKVEYSGGRELVVSAALQVGARHNLVETVLPELERTFADDCTSVVIYTKRGGLVRKLERAGYQDAKATIMRKKLK